MAQTHPRTRDRLRQRTSGRIVGLDMARALALFGMMATHLVPESTDGRTVAWWQQLAGGRAAALFALLAGVTLAIITDRAVSAAERATADGETDEGEAAAAETAEDSTDADKGVRRAALKSARAAIRVRAGVIGVVGLLLGSMETGIAVILTYYAVLFVLGLPFLGLRWRRLAVLAAVWAVAAPVLSHLVRPYLPERLGPSPSFDFLALEPVRLLCELLFTGYYPTVPWMAYLLAGMAIARLPLRRAGVAATLAVTGAALALAAWASSWLVLHRLGGLEHLRATAPDTSPFDVMPVDQALVRGTFGTTPTTSWWWLTTSAPHSSTPFDLFQTIGSAMLVIGLCLLACHAAPRTLAVVFAAGTMTLTLYSLHLVALAVGVGPPRDSVELFWWHIAAALAFGALWRAGVGRGPLEALTGTWSQRMRDTVLRSRLPR